MKKKKNKNKHIDTLVLCFTYFCNLHFKMILFNCINEPWHSLVHISLRSMITRCLFHTSLDLGKVHTKYDTAESKDLLLLSERAKFKPRFLCHVDVNRCFLLFIFMECFPPELWRRCLLWSGHVSGFSPSCTSCRACRVLRFCSSWWEFGLFWPLSSSCVCEGLSSSPKPLCLETVQMSLPLSSDFYPLASTRWCMSELCVCVFVFCPLWCIWPEQPLYVPLQRLSSSHPSAPFLCFLSLFTR